MALLQKKQPVVDDALGRNADARPCGVVGRRGEEEAIGRDVECLDIGVIDGKGQQQQVEAACDELRREGARLRLADGQVEIRVLPPQGHEQLRQQVRTDRRDHAEPDGGRKRRTATRGVVRHVAQGG